MLEKDLQSQFVDADYSVTEKMFQEKMKQGNMDYLQGLQDGLNFYFCELSKVCEISSLSAGAAIAIDMYRNLSMTYMHMTKHLNNMWKEQSANRQEGE